MTSTKPLLEVDGLTLRIGSSGRTVVNNVSFSVSPGEIVGIVGESGSGKTLAARAVMGFIPPAVRLISGSIRFDGEAVTTMAQKRLRAIRGAKVGMVFQEPMTSLNPSMLIGRQLKEGLALHRKLDANGRRELILDMLRRVGIRDPEGAFNAYPHQYSGGMRQRIMLASVMLLKPALLLADEPTTALDAVVQRDVMELMVELTRENGTAVLLISHDLGMVARYCSRIVVMCQGDVVEQGKAEDLLARPQHPYTRKLLAAMPHREPAREKGRHRLAQAGQRLGSPLELVVANFEYDRIARRNDGGNARQRGEKADFPDKFALSDFCDSLANALPVHREASRQNDEEAVRPISLTNENLAASQNPAIGVCGQSLQRGQRRLVEQQRRRQQFGGKGTGGLHRTFLGAASVNLSGSHGNCRTDLAWASLKRVTLFDARAGGNRTKVGWSGQLTQAATISMEIKSLEPLLHAN